MIAAVENFNFSIKSYKCPLITDTFFLQTLTELAGIEVTLIAFWKC